MTAPLPTFESLAPLSPPPDFALAASKAGIEFEGEELDRLGRFLAALLETNKTTNLTAIREPSDAWMRHILDSLTLLGPLSELPPGARIIDVGSGGGLPGLPLAITMPGARFTLLEATGKKAEFLRAVVAWMGLTNVEVLQDRAEHAAHDRGSKSATGGGRTGGHREAYDAVVARAVGRLHTLAELTVPFAKPPGNGRAGLVLLIKGQKADEELVEVAGPLGALHVLKAVHVGTIDTPTGRIVVLEKGAATPKVYPRADGEPSRAPLGAAKADRPRATGESKQPRKAGLPGARPRARPDAAAPDSDRARGRDRR